MASQLNSDDLKERRTGLADSLDILPAIKHLRPDSGLGRLFPERISRIDAEVLGVHPRAEVAGESRALRR